MMYHFFVLSFLLKRQIRCLWRKTFGTHYGPMDMFNKTFVKAVQTRCFQLTVVNLNTFTWQNDVYFFSTLRQLISMYIDEKSSQYSSSTFSTSCLIISWVTPAVDLFKFFCFLFLQFVWLSRSLAKIFLYKQVYKTHLYHTLYLLKG